MSNLPVLRIPEGLGSMLPDLKGWTNRFPIKSESSSRVYIVSQNLRGRWWGCSCPSWRVRRSCKHLQAVGVPSHEQPYEVQLEGKE